MILVESSSTAQKILICIEKIQLRKIIPPFHNLFLMIIK